MIPAGKAPSGVGAAMGAQLWRGVITAASTAGYELNVPALSKKRAYRNVERLETVVDWADTLSSPLQWLHAGGDGVPPDPHPVIPVLPYGVGDRVLVTFVDDSPVILGRLV